MKTLVIHPADRTTTFLEPVYEAILQKVVIKGDVSRDELSYLIRSHDRIMMMGHGSPWGLLSVGRFPGSGMHIIDSGMADILKDKENSVFIWCNADQFVREHELSGFYSGMFISEVGESRLMGLKDVIQSQVDHSNLTFGNIARKYMNYGSSREIWSKVVQEYGKIAEINPVAAYNCKRLYC
jgi:hypothetical protein